MFCDDKKRIFGGKKTSTSEHFESGGLHGTRRAHMRTKDVMNPRIVLKKTHTHVHQKDVLGG